MPGSEIAAANIDSWGLQTPDWGQRLRGGVPAKGPIISTVHDGLAGGG